ncbi:MAG: UDP-3-O-acyl-N-acetylglucosamine deacetylase [Candidatus Caenarcaniphilales bacterium]|nr:UDP-3-O-acyl-N-acetylglucosamine deacetylase [Candidatus Caenarcaniphilales bacterium]
MNQPIIQHCSKGTISKKDIKLQFCESKERGIYFVLNNKTKFPANTDFLTSATRNTVLGKDNDLICFVEHLLAAINLLKINQIEIHVDGQEIPLIDGSAQPWIELLKNWPYKEAKIPPINLPEPIYIQADQERSIIAYPNDEFKMTYLFESPVDQTKSWTSWTPDNGIEKLAKARTFGSVQEHEMLGIKGQWLSYDENGFDLPLYYPEEPATHKLLDLFGDLSLSGINPLSFKAHFISIKGGHSMNTKIAKQIKQIIGT